MSTIPTQIKKKNGLPKGVDAVTVYPDDIGKLVTQTVTKHICVVDLNYNYFKSNPDEMFKLIGKLKKLYKDHYNLTFRL